MNKAKPKTESLPMLIKELDGVFSRYIHLRDALPNGRFICISCGKEKPISEAQAGHYYPRGTMSTRFDEDNVHLECVYDNCFNKDHLKGYLTNLLMKIGQDRLWQLDQKAKQMKKWTHYELKELIEYYKEKIKQIK